MELESTIVPLTSEDDVGDKSDVKLFGEENRQSASEPDEIISTESQKGCFRRFIEKLTGKDHNSQQPSIELESQSFADHVGGEMDGKLSGEDNRFSASEHNEMDSTKSPKGCLRRLIGKRTEREQNSKKSSIELESQSFANDIGGKNDGNLPEEGNRHSASEIREKASTESPKGCFRRLVGKQKSEEHNSRKPSMELESTPFADDVGDKSEVNLSGEKFRKSTSEPNEIASTESPKGCLKGLVRKQPSKEHNSQEPSMKLESKPFAANVGEKSNVNLSGEKYRQSASDHSEIASTKLPKGCFRELIEKRTGREHIDRDYMSSIHGVDWSYENPSKEVDYPEIEFNLDSFEEPIPLRFNTEHIPEENANSERSDESTKNGSFEEPIPLQFNTEHIPEEIENSERSDKSTKNGDVDNENIEDNLINSISEMDLEEDSRISKVDDKIGHLKLNSSQSSDLTQEDDEKMDASLNEPSIKEENKPENDVNEDVTARKTNRDNPDKGRNETEGSLQNQLMSVPDAQESQFVPTPSFEQDSRVQSFEAPKNKLSVSTGSEFKLSRPPINIPPLPMSSAVDSFKPPSNIYSLSMSSEVKSIKPPMNISSSPVSRGDKTGIKQSKLLTEKWSETKMNRNFTKNIAGRNSLSGTFGSRGSVPYRKYKEGVKQFRTIKVTKKIREPIGWICVSFPIFGDVRNLSKTNPFDVGIKDLKYRPVNSILFNKNPPIYHGQNLIPSGVLPRS